MIEDQHFVYMIVEFIKGENLFERLESTYTISERQVIFSLFEFFSFLSFYLKFFYRHKRW